MDNQADEQWPPQDDPGGHHIQQHNGNNSSEQRSTKFDQQKPNDPKPRGNQPGTAGDEGEFELRFCTHSSARERAQFRSSPYLSVTKGPDHPEGPGMSAPYDNEKRLKKLDPTPTDAKWESVHDGTNNVDGTASAEQLRKGSGKNNLNERGIHSPFQKRVGEHKNGGGSRNDKTSQYPSSSTATWKHPVNSSTR